MLLAVLVYLLVVAILKIVHTGSVIPLFSQWTFLVGIPLGALFVWLDLAVNAYLHPDGKNARLLKGTINGGGTLFQRGQQTIKALRALTASEDHLCSQNILFAGLWIVMALFGLTSTTSPIGKGLVLGIGLQLVVRTLRSLRQMDAQGEAAFHWFYWPVKRAFTLTEERWVAEGFLVVFLLLTLLA